VWSCVNRLSGRTYHLQLQGRKSDEQEISVQQAAMRFIAVNVIFVSREILVSVKSVHSNVNTVMLNSISALQYLSGSAFVECYGSVMKRFEGLV
jgi:hypothetical protein